MPQHFQQLASRFEGLIQNTAASGSSFPWGILSFEYDRSALVNGSLRVLRLEAILRDGLYIRAGSELGLDLELNLKGHTDQARSTSLPIYVVVPGQQSLSTRGELARYSSYEGEVTVDETTGEDGVAIPRLRPRVALWAGDLPPSRYQNVPLMHVDAQGEAFTQADYIAPCVAVAANSALGRMCGDALIVVRTRSYLLVDQLRNGVPDQDDPEVYDLKAKVRALSTGLPPAEAALQCGCMHPFAVYLQMCQLAGHVAALTPELVPPQFRVYQHTELRQTFESVLSFIRMAVTEAVVESWLTLPFRVVEGRFELPANEHLDKAIGSNQNLSTPGVVLGLRPPPGVNDESVFRWVEGCVIATSNFIPTFLSNRVSGAERRRADRVPGLVPSRGTVLLPLVLDESNAQPGEALELIERFTNEGRPSEAVLYVRRPEGVQKG